MKHHASLIIAALFIALLAACSKHSPASQPSKDLGIVEMSAGTLSRQDLGGDRYLLITPEVLTNGRVRMDLVVEEKDAHGVVQKSEAWVTTDPDRPVDFTLAETDVHLTPRIKP